MSDARRQDSDTESVREQVREAYARAVSTPNGGCCGEVAGAQGPEPCSPTQKGSLAKAAGYGETDLESLPEDAVQNSFGCGNPLAFSGVKEGETVLDLGSGAGIDLIIAAKKVGASGRVIGVDMTDEMIEHARNNVRKAGFENIEVRKGNIENLPVDDASVDQVISNCVINLSPEKEKVFAEIARVLKPGGRMSVSDVVVEDLPEWIREHAVFHSACVAGAISEEAYLTGLREAGLTNPIVRDRIIYDDVQLRALVMSEDTRELLKLDDAELDELASSISGRIWSARIEATKA